MKYKNYSKIGECSDDLITRIFNKIDPGTNEIDKEDWNLLNYKSISYFLTIISMIISQFNLNSQDPYFQNFHSAQSYFNPSLIGISGSTSLHTKHRRQWNVLDPLFETTYFSLEESLPCALLDWGISLLNDVEGTAALRTREFSASIAGTIPFGNRKNVHNIRIGFSSRFAKKSIDFSRLTFSDQLDPKYGFSNQAGNLNPTSFVSPGNSSSPSFFSPSIGASMISVWGVDSKTPTTTTFGAAIYHVLSLGNNFGGVESLHNIDGTARIPARYSLFFTAETILLNTRDFYLMVSPQVYYHRQSEIEYFEIGGSFSKNRDVSFGMYYHWSPKNFDQPSANSLVFQFDIGMIKLEKHRVDLGINFTQTLTGLKNLRSNTFEVSFTYHLRKSPTCRLFGLEDNPGSSQIECPGSKFPNMKRYMDMWYYTQG